jgi:hypothetical protein
MTLQRAKSVVSAACLWAFVGLGSIAGCEGKVAGGPAEVTCGQPGDIVSKDEEFAALEGCEIYRGTVISRHTVDLTLLSSLRVIRGKLTAGGYNSGRETLDGLERLEIVGDFDFLGDGLRDLSAVGNLREVQQSVRLDSLNHLTDLRGLENLRVVGGRMSISYNHALTSIAALSSLERVGGDLVIQGNPELPLAAIEELLERLEVGGEVYFHD